VGLAAELRAEGGLIAQVVRDPDEPDDGFPLLLQAIREGERLHYGGARVVVTEDEDLALLAGDRLYALGLEKLAQLGDLDAVAALADLISFAAQAHAEERPDAVPPAFDRVSRQISAP
jgi:hypothetical protein